MRIYNVQYREYYDGDLALTIAQIKAENLDEAKQKLLKSGKIKQSRILSDEALL